MTLQSPRIRDRIGLGFSRQELALIAITVVWGATFLVIHLAMRHSGPLFFVGVRFATAGVVSLAVFRSVMTGLTLRELAVGTVTGVTIFIGFSLQTLGLQTISSSESAFLTALYVPIVPLLQWLVFRRRPRLMSWVGIGLAFTGLVLLAGPTAGPLTLSRGAIATVISAFAFAAMILLIGRFAGETDSRRMTVVQLLTASILSLMVMPIVGETIPSFAWGWVAPAFGLGIASAFIQLTMNWAQRTVSATRATVIYAGEPVWGGVFGWMAGDRLPALAGVGAALIVAGVLASERKEPPRVPRGHVPIPDPSAEAG
jgi:drug/metabolite transporter (DMT)-like permease